MTPKQRAFVEHMLAGKPQAEAAELAGYAFPYDVAATQALLNPEVNALCSGKIKRIPRSHTGHKPGSRPKVAQGEQPMPVLCEAERLLAKAAVKKALTRERALEILCEIAEDTECIPFARVGAINQAAKMEGWVIQKHEHDVRSVQVTVTAEQAFEALRREAEKRPDVRVRLLQLVGGKGE
jgi:hypothetical protein